MLSAVPLAALIAIFIATLLRGQSIKRQSGDHPWAFASAKSGQRIAGMAFAASVAVLGAASAIAAMREPSGWTWPAAIAAVVGAALVVVAQIQMGRAWRVGVRAGDAPLFISHGLFRFSRNPIFLGMILIGLGVAVGAAIWWAWAAWLAFVIVCDVQVRIEEAHLAANFGEQYHRFRSTVPRWIGIGIAVARND